MTAAMSATEKVTAQVLRKHDRAPSTDPSLLPLHAELQRAYDFFNRHFFSGELPPVVMSFFPQPPNGNRLGHYQPGSWDTRQLVEGKRNRSKPVEASEIIFYADLCLSRGHEQVLETLLHEMVHHWQFCFGEPGQNNYHNLEWHSKCAEVGLVTDPKDRKGHSRAGAKFASALAAFEPRVEAFPFRRQANRKKGRMVKWICGCGYAVRIGKKKFNATCNDCGQVFARATTDED